MNLKSKYLKYKIKYLKLKEPKLLGGNIQIFTMNLDDKWFNFIENNQKTIEGRIYDDKRKKLRVGDFIEFKNNKTGKYIKKEIDRLEITQGDDAKFEKVINESNFKLLIPDANTVADAINVYNNIPGYKQKALIEGIILIYLK